MGFLCRHNGISAPGAGSSTRTILSQVSRYGRTRAASEIAVKNFGWTDGLVAGQKTFTFGITESEVLTAAINRLPGSRLFSSAITEYLNSSYSPPPVVPVVIKSASKTSATTSLVINTGWSAPTAGNTIIIVASGKVGGSNADSTFNFPAGFTQIATSLYNQAGSQRIAIAYKVSAGNESTLSVSMTGTMTFMGAIALEVTNLNTSNIRFTVGNNGVLSDSMTLSHSPLGGNNNFYVYGVGDFQGYNLANALSYGSGFTEVTECAGDGNVKLGVAVKNDTALNGETVTATTSAGTSLMTGVLVCFGDQSLGPTFPLKRARSVSSLVNETETLAINTATVVAGSASGYAGSVTEGSGGVAWTNPSNAIGAVNGTIATVSLTMNKANDLAFQNFGFSIPSDAVITEVRITTTYSNTSSVFNGVCWLEANVSSPTFDSKLKVSATSAGSLRTVTFGAGEGFGVGFFTPSIVNSTSFGVILQASATGTVSIGYDAIAIGISYVTNSQPQQTSTQYTSSATGTNWTNLTNLGSVDSAYVTASFSAGTLYASIPAFSLPANAVVLGTTININSLSYGGTAFTYLFRAQTTFNSISSPVLQVEYSGTPGGPASYVVKQGPPSISGMSAINLNAGGQIAITFYGSLHTISIDAVSMTVYYYIPKSGFNISKKITLNIDEFVNYVISSIGAGEKLFALTIAEAYGYVIAAARNRRVTLTDAQAETLAIATVNRARRMPFALSSAESLSSNFGRTRNVQLSVVEAETIVDSLVRSRKIAAGLVESIVYSINTLVPPFTLFAFTIAETETYVLAALRQRKITLTNTEVEALAVTTLARLKNVQTSVIETEVLAAPLKRTRTSSFSIAEIEVLSSNIVRARKVATSINELEVINAALSVARLKSLGFALAEIEALAVAIKRTRNVQSAVAEVIADAMNVVRNRNVAPSIIETQAQATTIVRNRNVVLPLNESLVITSSLARLKLAALSLAETFGYSFNVSKIKALTAAITEIEGFSFGSLRRTRNVVEAINEVISFAGSLSRTKLVGLSLNEIEALSETLKRARAVQVALSEVETVSLSLARKKTIAASIAEVESISVNVAKLKMMSYVIQQTEGHSFWLARARNAQFSMNELEAMQASFNRARAYVLPIGESENFNIDFGRLRSQVLVIAETQGLTTALNRVREVLQSISNATGYTFELRKTIGEPNIIRVTVQWQEFVTEGPNQVLKNFSEELISYAKVSSTVNVPAIGTSTVVVPANEVDTLFLGDETTILFVPNNTF